MDVNVWVNRIDVNNYNVGIGNRGELKTTCRNSL